MIRFRNVLSATKSSAWYPLNDLDGKDTLEDLKAFIKTYIVEHEIVLKPTDFDPDIWEDNFNRQYKGIVT